MSSTAVAQAEPTARQRLRSSHQATKSAGLIFSMHAHPTSTPPSTGRPRSSSRRPSTTSSRTGRFACPMRWLLGIACMRATVAARATGTALPNGRHQRHSTNSASKPQSSSSQNHTRYAVMRSKAVSQAVVSTKGGG